MDKIEYYDYKGYPTNDLRCCFAAYIPVVNREATVKMIMKFIKDLEDVGGCIKGLEVSDNMCGWFIIIGGVWQRLSIIDIDRLNTAIKNHNQNK